MFLILFLTLPCFASIWQAKYLLDISQYLGYYIFDFLYFSIRKSDFINFITFGLCHAFAFAFEGFGRSPPEQGHRSLQRSGGVSMYPCVPLQYQTPRRNSLSRSWQGYGQSQATVKPDRCLNTMHNSA